MVGLGCKLHDYRPYVVGRLEPDAPGGTVPLSSLLNKVVGKFLKVAEALVVRPDFLLVDSVLGASLLAGGLDEGPNLTVNLTVDDCGVIIPFVLLYILVKSW